MENVLGEIGRGHIIAFNILNLGRLKLGRSPWAAPRMCWRSSLKYAKERKAFGKSIAEFGMIQHKLAEMAIRIYAAETHELPRRSGYRGQLEGFAWDQPDARRRC